MSTKASVTSTSLEKTAVKRTSPHLHATKRTLAPTQASARPIALQRAMDARPSEILVLQREYGNRAVNRLLSSHNVQPKLNVGPADDRYEQEADRVAAKVLTMVASQAMPLQRSGEEYEEVQNKPLVGSIARLVQRAPEDDDRQARPLLQQQIGAEGGDATPDLETALDRTRGGGQPLDAGLQRTMGQAMGADFSAVRVHTDTQADRLNRYLQARAFTTGPDLYFREGEYAPTSRGGQALIAHELTHVVQQTGAGRTTPSIGRKMTQPISSYLQRALWSNAAARFRTDPGMPNIPHSEYLVNSTGYQRYAPINKQRAPNEVYFEGPRSFVYVQGADDSAAFDALWDTPKVTAVTPTQVTFKSRQHPEAPSVTGNIAPQAGYTVYDLDVDGAGNGQNQHVGHPVENLGQPLPTLDDPEKRANVKALQANYLMLSLENENKKPGEKITPTGK